MRNFQQKSRWRRIMQSKPVLIFLGILVCIFAYGVAGFMGKMRTTRENRVIAQKKIEELTKEKEKLAEDIARLETGEGKEASIREKFGLAKEGEGLIVVVDDNTEGTAQEAKHGFWASLKSWFDN